MNFSSGSLFTLCFPSFESFPFFYLSATLFCGLTRELWNIDRKKSLIHHLQPLEELIDSEARKNVHWSIWDNPILEIFRMYIPDQNCRGFRHPISNICHTFMEDASTLMLMSLCNENGSRESSESSTKGDLARWLTPFRGSFFNAWWQRQIKDLHHSLFWPWDKDRVSLVDKRVTHFFSTQAKHTEGENWSPERRSAKPRIHCAKLVPPVRLSTCNFTALNSMFYVGEKGGTLAIRTSG